MSSHSVTCKGKDEKELLRFCGLDELYPLQDNVSRFRGIYLEGGDVKPFGFGFCVSIMTRTGGGNREEYASDNEWLSSMPTCIQSADYWGDTTCIEFNFKILEKHKAAAKKMYEK